jgi:RNA polymerase sigma factor (sigma-70 family)
LKKGAAYTKEWSAFIHSEDEEAFHGLYVHYFKYLYFIGLKKGFPADRIKDHINDLFLYLWEKRKSLNSISNYHNYIITAFLRKLYRKDKNETDDHIDLSDLAELQHIPSVESLHIAQAAREDLSRALRAYVEKLPGKQQQMIYQKFYLGLSYTEISAANNVSINTVYNTIYKALEKLKGQIDKDKIFALKIVLFVLVWFCLVFLKKNM